MSKELQDSLRQLHEYAENLKNYINKQESNELDIDGLLSEYGVDLKKFEEDFMLDKSKISLPFVRLSPDAVSPKFNYETDSGFDLHSIVDIEIPALGRALVPTGLSFDIKDGFEIQVRSKSGLAINQGLMCLNSPGTVDCFSEDMKILTIEGEKTISELKLGDTVFSFNEESFDIEKDTITHIFNTEEQEILQIETEQGILEVTPNSEIYTKNGIVLAKNLTYEDEIICFF